MVTIKHKQSDKIESISITVWLKKYNHDVWDILKIEDAVDLFTFQNEKWVFHNTVEKNDALQVIEQHPNNFKYEISFLNTPKVENILITSEDENLKNLNMVKNSATSDYLLSTFRKLKLNFPKLYISNTGGVGTYFDFDVNPNDYLKFAKKDLRGNDTRGFINAISNAKRAIDCQTDKILSILKIPYDEKLPAAAANFIKLVGKEIKSDKHALQLIEALGLAPILSISKVRALRNGLEHYYELPTLEQCNNAIELAEFYINGTENKIKNVNEMFFSNTEYDYSFESEEIGFGFSYNASTGTISTITRYKDESFERFEISSNDMEFYILLKISFFDEDEDELNECIQFLLTHIGHPQSKLKVAVKTS